MYSLKKRRITTHASKFETAYFSQLKMDPKYLYQDRMVMHSFS